jgi:hypothetical protein
LQLESHSKFIHPYFSHIYYEIRVSQTKQMKNRCRWFHSASSNLNSRERLVTPLLDLKSPNFPISEVQHFSFTLVMVIFPCIMVLMVLWAHVLPSVHTLIPIDYFECEIKPVGTCYKILELYHNEQTILGHGYSR